MDSMAPEGEADASKKRTYHPGRLAIHVKIGGALVLGLGLAKMC